MKGNQLKGLKLAPSACIGMIFFFWPSKNNTLRKCSEYLGWERKGSPL